MKANKREHDAYIALSPKLNFKRLIKGKDR